MNDISTTPLYSTPPRIIREDMKKYGRAAKKILYIPFACILKLERFYWVDKIQLISGN